jgi:hypothetical protein
VKRNILLTLIAATALAAPAALADPGHGHGNGNKPTPTGASPDPAPVPDAHGNSAGPHGNGQASAHPQHARPLCKPVVSYILRGAVVSVGTDTVVMHVTAGNAHAHVFAGQDVTLAVSPTTKIRRDGPAEPSKLLAGDRLMVQVRGCKSVGATVALVAVRVFAHAAPADAAATGDGGDTDQQP